MARSLGAVAVGCAKAGLVCDEVADAFARWLAEGRHGTMGYMERNVELRLDPRLLLPGASTIIALAFPYRPPRDMHHSYIADFALGRDYHHVLRERLEPLCKFMAASYGAISRVCVDSAPIMERYWAVKAGLGFIGLNRQLIVPGVGSGVFLAEVVTTLSLPPDSPLVEGCGDCGRCVDACPGGALLADSIDGRLCRSYLSIEHKGLLPDEVSLGSCAYGCDICQRVCPHNAGEPPVPLDEFLPNTRLMNLDLDGLSRLTSGDWRRLTADSPMKRITIGRFRSNLQHVAPEEDSKSS